MTASGPALILAVEGPSAAGKSSLVARTSRRLGWVPLAEAYDRLEPPPDLRFSTDRELRAIESVLLEEEARRWAAARALRAEGRTVIADTDFLGPVTYTAGLVALGRASPASLRFTVRRARSLARGGRWGVPDGLLYLATSPAVRAARAARDPGRHPPDLAERHEAVGRWEERFYRDVVRRQVPAHVRFLAADRPLDRIVADVRSAARSVARIRRPSTIALRLLADLEEAPPPAVRRGAPSATVKKPPLSPRAPRR